MTQDLQQQWAHFCQAAQAVLHPMCRQLVNAEPREVADGFAMAEATQTLQTTAAALNLSGATEVSQVLADIWQVLHAHPLAWEANISTSLRQRLESLEQRLDGSSPEPLAAETLGGIAAELRQNLHHLQSLTAADQPLDLTFGDLLGSDWSVEDVAMPDLALPEVSAVAEAPLPNLWEDMADWLPVPERSAVTPLPPELLAQQAEDAWNLQDLDLLAQAADLHAIAETLPSLARHDSSVEQPEGAIASFDLLTALIDEPAPEWTGLPASAVFDALEALIEQTPTPLLEEASAAFALSESTFSDPAVSLEKRAEAVLRVPVRQMDILGNLVGEVVVNRNSLANSRERLQETLESLLQQVQSLSHLGEQMRDAYEGSLLESALLGNQRVSTSGSPTGPTTNADQEFDLLEMDRFSSFHTVSQEMIELTVRMRESAADIAFIVNEPLDQLNRNFQQISSQLQEGVNRVRMAPFSELAGRLPRSVRQVAQRLGRSVRLVIEGEETLIDKGILQRLQDPMTHLINNALAHGIESPEKRQQVGKPSQGTLRIHAYLQGNRTIISVADDGAGINLERVKQKAIQARLLTLEEAESLDKRDIYDFLFHPGFSTRDKADDLSGRGVGMDVVRTVLKEIQGEIVTDSEPGQGTTFTIRLPQTLSIAKAIVCLSDRNRIAIPMDSVLETLDLARHRLQPDAQGHLQLLRGGRVVPVRLMSDLLRYTQRKPNPSSFGGRSAEDVVPLVLLSSGGEQLALEVDQVEGEREIVIKPLDGPVPRPLGLAGVTIQADGRVMAIADVMQLFDLAQGRKRIQAAHWRLPETSEAAPSATVLIVDDSITVRKLLSSTFKKAGYQVEQASNGQEALEKLHTGLACELIFCDIEMPKMNGLELLERLQANNELKHIPVAMLTSRGAERHRQIAARLGARAYFTKPYLEDTLLDAAKRLLQGEQLLIKR
jgi:chemosensory pili system protein ChpA (sensor histidine kinase/response regulator)